MKFDVGCNFAISDYKLLPVVTANILMSLKLSVEIKYLGDFWFGNVSSRAFEILAILMSGEQNHCILIVNCCT